MIYAIIGYDHRGCQYRYKNLKLVLEYYMLESEVEVLLVTNIPQEIKAWCLQEQVDGVTIIEHAQHGAYSHNETLLVGLEHVPDGAIAAFMDADVVFIRGRLSDSLSYLSESELVSPRGAMSYTNEQGEIVDACIPVGSVLARKELLRELVLDSGGKDIRGWGAEDVALLVAARKRGIFAVRHDVETLHLWHPEAPRSGKSLVLQKVTDALGLPAMDSLEFRFEPLKQKQKEAKKEEASSSGVYCALRGLGSAHYLREVCASDEPLEIHIHSNGRDDYLGQVHYAGVVIHRNNLPCEKSAKYDEVGERIWNAHISLAEGIGTSKENSLFNLWYATVALGWNIGAWLNVKAMAFGEFRDFARLESLAAKGLKKALNQYE